jgi:hypothetical protein
MELSFRHSLSVVIPRESACDTISALILRRRASAVSKDSRALGACVMSFETRAGRAPQDEGEIASQPRKRRESGGSSNLRRCGVLDPPLSQGVIQNNSI